MSLNFHPTSPEDAMRLVPPGSQENTYMRMVLGYWEMVASIANRGLVDEELLFENSGEQWGVWEQVKPLAGTWRTMFANPQFLGNLEEHCKRLEARRASAPEGLELLTFWLPTPRDVLRYLQSSYWRLDMRNLCIQGRHCICF
jgi:hypothetical protein